MRLPAYRRGDLKDSQWQRLRPLLPPQKPNTGRPSNDHRQVLNGMLWILRTGAPWRDLPTAYGSWPTVSGRFYRWRKSGLWSEILQRLQQQADQEGRINWDIHFVDGSVIRAHQHAAGAKHSDGATEALGYSKGGFSTKIHLRCDGNGLPMTMLLTVGERHEAVMFETLMEQGAVKHSKGGRPRIRPKRVAGDKGYSSRKIRVYLRRRGIRYTIPRKSNEHRGGKFDKEQYRQRNRVERLFGRLKQYRRIATRYEKKAANYLAMVTLASIILWL